MQIHCLGHAADAHAAPPCLELDDGQARQRGCQGHHQRTRPGHRPGGARGAATQVDDGHPALDGPEDIG